jgi:hypothetical protein
MAAWIVSIIGRSANDFAIRTFPNPQARNSAARDPTKRFVLKMPPG